MLIPMLNLLLPIFTVLALGFMGRRQGWLTEAGVNTFKSLIGNVLLPIIMFNAMFTSSPSLSSIVTIAAVFIGFCLALAAGFGLKKFFPGFGKYLPFLISTCESGMLGYPLITMLFGDKGPQNFAMADLPHGVFFFAVALTFLQITDGLTPSPKAIVKNIFSAKPFVGMISGLILGLLGLDDLLSTLPIWSTYTTMVSFITAPTTVLVLLFLGYSISITKETFKPVVTTAVLRLIVTGVIAALTAFAVFLVVPFDKPLLYSILLVFMLPPSFSIPIFSKLEGSE